MSQNTLYDIQRRLLLHQTGRQCVPQCVGIYLFDFAPLGYGGQADLKGLGINVTGVCQREDVPHQQFAQPIRNRDLPV